MAGEFVIWNAIIVYCLAWLKRKVLWLLSLYLAVILDFVEGCNQLLEGNNQVLEHLRL